MQTQVKIWKKYGAYLIGVTGIARENPNASFQQFINACDGQYGGWSIEALNNAWNKGALSSLLF